MNVILVNISNARLGRRYGMLSYYVINVPDGIRDVPTSNWDHWMMWNVHSSLRERHPNFNDFPF